MKEPTPPVYRILVVDDDEVDRMALRRALQGAPITTVVDEVATGEEALAAMDSRNHDCIILDYRLPPPDGLEVLTEARARGIDIPIVMLTGEGDEMLAAKVIRAGASDYLSKADISSEVLVKSLRYVSRMHESEQLQRQLASFPEQAPTPIIEVNQEGKVTYLNPAATDVFSTIGEQRWEHPILATSREAIGGLPDSSSRTVTREAQMGRSFYHLTISQAPNTPLFRIYAIDITDRKKAEEQLVRSAFYDMLTNLPNRALFTDRLGRSLERTKRHRDHRFAVLFLDLDRFKVVNDSLGHLSGDQLLVSAANRLRACVRAADTVARFGGDEFAVLIENPSDIADVMYVAERISREFAQPFILDDGEAYTTTSIGIALSERGYDCPEDLLRDADIAMYRAKAQGGARCQVFDAEMHAQAIAMLQLQTELRHAITREQLRLYYQPIVALEDGGLIGFEALVRWQHPHDGLIGPQGFLRPAVDTGIIHDIDRWVLTHAIRQMDAWRVRFGAERTPAVSINLSSGQFFHHDLIPELEYLMRATGVAACPSAPVLEISESTIMDDIDDASRVLSAIKTLGVRISVDGFGTGSFSLGCLRRLPVDSLEIDRSFVANMPMESDSVEFARAIIGLAKNLGIGVLAEGIENRFQLESVIDLHCDCAQGYLFARPMSAEAAQKLIDTNHTWRQELHASD